MEGYRPEGAEASVGKSAGKNKKGNKDAKEKETKVRNDGTFVRTVTYVKFFNEKICYITIFIFSNVLYIMSMFNLYGYCFNGLH